MASNQPFAYPRSRNAAPGPPAPAPNPPGRYQQPYYQQYQHPPYQQQRPQPHPYSVPNNSHPLQQSASTPSPSPSPPSLVVPVRPTGDRQRLYSDKQDRERYDDMAAIFSLITATERLENMWARRGAISQQDYEIQCDRLIKQYKTLSASTANAVPNLRRFIAEYDCKAGLACPRLEEGVPATVLGETKNVYKYVMTCTTMFHQLADFVDMDQTTVGQLLPELSTLNRNLETIKRMASHSSNFQQKINSWAQRLNEMPAHKKLSDEDAAQLKLDLDTSFQEFERAFQ